MVYMLSFKVNPVYTSLSILLKLRKDVPEIEFSIQVLNETEKFPFRFHYVLNIKWHQEISRSHGVLEKKWINFFIHLQSRCVFFIIIVKPIAFLTFFLPSMSWLQSSLICMSFLTEITFLARVTYGTCWSLSWCGCRRINRLDYF